MHRKAVSTGLGSKEKNMTIEQAVAEIDELFEEYQSGKRDWQEYTLRLHTHYRKLKAAALAGKNLAMYLVDLDPYHELSTAMLSMRSDREKALTEYSDAITEIEV